MAGDWSPAMGYQPAQAMWYITLIPQAKHSSLSYKYKINPNAWEYQSVALDYSHHIPRLDRASSSYHLAIF